METLLLENNEENLINQLKTLKDFLIYYNVITDIKIGNHYSIISNNTYNTLISDDKINILTNDRLLKQELLNKLDMQFNEVIFKSDEEKETTKNNNTKVLSVINRKSDLDNFFKIENKGTLYTNTMSRIKILYPNQYGSMLKLYEYNFKCAIETNNRICIFKRGTKIRATTLAKQNNFELSSNYYDNPTVYKKNKLY
jgi:hypothetical protein